MTTTTTGRCMCGNLRYAFTGEPVSKALCHCITCRHLSGSMFTTNLLVPAPHFSLTSGTPKTYSTIQDSGMTLTYSFCADCGCTISKVGDAEAFNGIVIVQAGSLDDTKLIDAMEPAAELFVKERAGWLKEMQGMGQMHEFT